MREILTVGELAAHWQCHQSTIYRLLYRKKLRAFKVGSDWRFSTDAIREYEQRGMEQDRVKIVDGRNKKAA